MKFGTIASGSSGNCLYVGSESTNLLIDAGISCKRICQGLGAFDLEGKDIHGILITHEHSDHISGLGVLSRKFHIPIYGTEKTLRQISEMENLGKIDNNLFQVIQAGSSFSIFNKDSGINIGICTLTCPVSLNFLSSTFTIFSQIA